MAAERGGPRVLALVEDPRGLVTACRVHAPLFALKRLGLIDDYCVGDAQLTGVPHHFPFDVLWLQRARDAALVERCVAAFDRAYLLDIDDLLIGRPGYIEASELPGTEHAALAIAHCRVLTSTSERLTRLLEQRVGVSLLDRHTTCVNALEFPAAPPRPAERPAGVVFAQSHRLALTASREHVFAAVREFVQRRGLPLYYFGPPPDVLGAGVAAGLGLVVACGYLDFWRYHAVLAALPPAIGIAPLETVGDPETLDFIAGKSDVKMVEYGGFGHPGVYSRAAPYVDTDLRAGVLAQNTYEDWTAALEAQIGEGWSHAADEQARIVAARHLDVVAATAWIRAVENARLERIHHAAELLPPAAPAGAVRRAVARVSKGRHR
jgi:hypothetical protein